MDFNFQSGSPFESVIVHSFTFFHIPESENVTLGLHSWLTPFHVFALVVSPRLGL